MLMVHIADSAAKRSKHVLGPPSRAAPAFDPFPEKLLARIRAGFEREELFDSRRRICSRSTNANTRL